MDTVYFDYLTVVEDDLERLTDEHEPSHPVPGSQWRMSYRRLPPKPLDPGTTRALSVADKLLSRGHVTLLPQRLEDLLGSRPQMGRPMLVAQAGSPSLDSEDERQFWIELLPTLLGGSFATWVTPQIEVASLTGSAEFSGSGQRVDFLLAHPSLSRAVVIEIDGAQHNSQAEGDAARDKHLAANGYDVLRIPVAEVRSGAGPALEQLRVIVSRLEDPSAFWTRLGSPVRRAGQLQMVLLQACYLGMLPLDGRKPRLSSDLLDHSQLTHDELSAVADDFAELLARVGHLYGVELLPEGIAVVSSPEEADLDVRFFEATQGEATMLVEDTYLPIQIKWQSRPVQAAAPKNVEPETILYFLQRVFRKRNYRDGQYDIISRALQTKDTVALLPTGAGKSIAFQLTGLLLPGRTIVVAPITSLIRDQVANLASYGIDRALGITGDLAGRDEREHAYELLKHGEAFFYYIAPERFQMAEFREKLRGMTAAFPVNMIVVDEAHCVSEWGHDFRTAYLRIGQTSRECSTSAGWTPALVALTGTASRAVLRDLQRELQITDFDAIVTPTSFDREELEYAVLHEKSEHKQHVLEGYMRNTLPAAFGLPPEAFFRKDGKHTYCGLIFCPNVNGSYGVVEVAGLLASAGIEAAYYAGTMPKGFYGDREDWKAYKRNTEKRFKANEVPVLVATKAFGMGVDKQNIRFTLHYGIPASIEAFYQEAGRAGRDGERAICTAIVSDDRSSKNQQLLSPATSIEEVARFVKETRYDENDDVTRSLFFHVQAFKGVPAEVAAVADLQRQLSPTGEKASRTIPFGTDSKMTEKALHRLVVVGVVDDYTVDYSGHQFSVTLADANRQSIIEKYVQYVSGYQRARADQERRNAQALPVEWDEFVIGVVGYYIQFVYDVIERGQRAAIANMLAACRSGSGEELRTRILDYLELAEFSEAIEDILSDDKGGISLIGEILVEIISPNDAARLRGPVSRSLETYPDHPGLLLLRAATEALSREEDQQTVVENFEAFLMNSRDRYGLEDEAVAKATGAVLKVVSRKNRLLASSMESAFVRERRSRESLRLLVQEGGSSTQLAPWILLNEASAAAAKYLT